MAGQRHPPPSTFESTFLAPTLRQLVRSVARRDTEDRTVSELIRFQDALDRLGILWTPFDYLDKIQSLELVRNLHVRTTIMSAPCDEKTYSSTRTRSNFDVLQVLSFTLSRPQLSATGARTSSRSTYLRRS